MSLTDELSPAGPLAAGCHVTVLTDRCAGCQECIVRCPTQALTLEVDRWVAVADDTRCVGCRQCVRTCPFTAIEVSGPALVAARTDPVAAPRREVLGDVSEVRGGFTEWEQALAEAARCLQCPDPTCVRGCPAHNDIPGFIAALRTGDVGRAAELLSTTTCLPDVCSRVCDWATQCEGACSWALTGAQPVAIGRLERFVAAHAGIRPPEVPAPDSESAALSVAVVGAGPAGIGAAWELVAAGARVTVYEREPAPGGLLSWGIPDFTLPDEVAGRPWRQLCAAGVELRCGVDVSPGDLDRLRSEHDAVILAHGAGAPLHLSVPGVELSGVVDATMFLQAARAALEPGGDPTGFRTALGLAGDRRPAVLVLGAGNTAMDVARCALRLGCAATCVDWLDERYALTRPDELAEARHEGVTVRFSRTLIRLDADEGRVARASLAVTTQRRPDRPPTVQHGAAETVAVDLVVMAMGYRTDGAFAAAVPGAPVRRKATGLPDRRWTASGLLTSAADDHRRPVGSLALDREVGLHTAAEPLADRVWVAGDALVGPATVVEAMAQGRRAAAAVLAATPRRPQPAAAHDMWLTPTDVADDRR